VVAQTQGGVPMLVGVGITRPMRPPTITPPPLPAANTEVEKRAKIIIVTIRAAIKRLRMVESEIFLIEI